MNPTKGVAFKLVSAALFAVMSALIRYLGARYPIGQVVFYRSLFAIVPVVVVYAWRGELATVVRTERPLGQAGRGVLSIAGMFFNFGATARLPLVESNAIAFSSPLFTVALAALILNERVRIYRWSAVVVGFVGVLVVLSPHLSGDELTAAISGAASLIGVVYAICGSLTNAGTAIQTRRLAQSESTSSIVFYFSLSCTLAGLATLPFGWVTPSGGEIVALISIGFLGGTGHIFLTESYSVCIRLTRRAVRLYLDDLGARPGLRDVRRNANIGNCAGFCDHRGGWTVRNLARTPARYDAAPRRIGDDTGAYRYDPPNALKVMMVRVSAIPGMLWTFSAIK
jgi:drug/metabolite transporter (DMT)-like permease